MSKRKIKQNAPLTVTRPELLVDGSDREFREMVHHALAFSARLESLRAGYANVLGLSGVEYTILIAIAHLQDEREVGVSAIAEHLMLAGPFVTSEVNKLVAKSLVNKTTNPKDKRRVILTITDHAQKTLERLAPIQQQVNNVHFGSVTRKEFDFLHRIFPDLARTTDEALSLLAHLAQTQKKVRKN